VPARTRRTIRDNVCRRRNEPARGTSGQAPEMSCVRSAALYREQREVR
jgi:hypothetical protein